MTMYEVYEYIAQQFLNQKRQDTGKNKHYIACSINLTVYVTSIHLKEMTLNS